MDKTVVLDKPEQIALFQKCVWRSALGLEIKGMSRRGPSVYSIVKQQMGFKGSKQKVWDQLDAYIKEAQASYKA